ncbi:MAG: DUF4352 domain-containing protein [Thermomicrobiales bacterium]
MSPRAALAPNAIAGSSRANPVPVGEPAVAGPLEITVLEVLYGADAVGAILNASGMNAEPRDGTTFVAVNLQVRNAGKNPLWVNNDDFALTGDSGLVRQFLGVLPPAPPLDQMLGPGEETSGWIALSAGVDEGNLLLCFASVSLGGNWANAVLALLDGAAIPDLAARVEAANTAGSDPTAPLGLGEATVTEQWAVELLDVVTGAAAFDLVDYRTGALGVEDAAGNDGSIWVALQFRVTNAQAGGAEAWFPTSAFTLADEAGAPVLDVATLTPPHPDASGGYYPGGTRDGWVMFDVPVEYTTSLVRFLPFANTTETPDPRYFSFA